MKTDLITLVGVVVTVILLGLAGCWQYAIWDECRDAGHSIPYCMRMISR